MEDMQKNTVNPTGTGEPAPADTEPGKTFTQDEVNSLVQGRVARLKSQVEKSVRSEYDAKFAELQQREMTIKVTEALMNRGLPKELASIINCTDDEDMNQKLSVLAKYVPTGSNTQPAASSEGFKFGTAAQTGQRSQGVDPIRKAMGL